MMKNSLKEMVHMSKMWALLDAYTLLKTPQSMKSAQFLMDFSEMQWKLACQSHHYPTQMAF